MSRRWQILMVGAIALLAIGLEAVVWRNHETRALVELVNDGDATLENLALSFDGTQIAVGDVAAGGSARVWLDGRRKGAITLSFAQLRNPMTGFFVDEVDTSQLAEESLKLVIHIRPNEVTRGVEDGEDEPTPLARLKRRVLDQLHAELSYFP